MTKAAIKKICFGVLDFFFPKFCVGCEGIGSYWCLKCRGETECKLKVVDFSNDEAINNLDYLIVGGSYKGMLKLAIHGLKYRFISSLAGDLGEWLGEGLEFGDDWLVTFVPLHRERLRWRGFNQAEELARVVARSCGLECFATLVRKEKGVIQAELEREERLENVRGIYEICGGCELRERKILIVDDVATTGATLNECAWVLKNEGAGQVVGLVLARGNLV